MADHNDNENSTDTSAADGSAPPADLLGGLAAEPAADDGSPAEPDAEPSADDLSEEQVEVPVAEAVTPQPEHELPSFGAQFSSPEPTTVTARPRRRATRPAVTADPDSVEPPAPQLSPVAPAFVSFVAPEPEVAAPRRRSRRPQAESPTESTDADAGRTDDRPATDERDEEQAPPRRSRSRRRSAAESEPVEAQDTETTEDTQTTETDERDLEDSDDRDGEDGGSSGSRRRRRGRRGRGRGRTGEDGADGDRDDEDTDTPAGAEESDDSTEPEGQDDDGEDDDAAEGGSGSSTRRRRRRRRRGSSGENGSTEDSTEDADDRPERAGRNGRTSSDDDVRGVAGSTRLEAKRQRRREGRDGGRRRAPILSESEFLARREAVDRAMVIRQQGERTQIAVLEDDVLVEHYVTQAQATSFAGNVYLGRVQNVLPSMEAAFVDIGKGRNAVLYAGEVNWDAAGLSGKSRSIETALKSGDKVLVQVTKDPIGHKGARLTQQVNLPGRFLVYVPGGSMTGISRKLPDKERQRLKDILKKIVPEDAGVIIRTAAEGASEEELTRDVARLQAQWEVIQTKASSTSNAPTLLYGEPDLAIRVIRDVFNEDFKRLVVQGGDAWDTVEAYVAHVSPELSERLQRYTGTGDVFRDLRIDEQLMKALDRKVWLPSGGSLVIDRTEAMTVVDVNTGKFVGSGGNLEQTVTRNNIEAAEEIVRQLRLRDIGGIIVIDFIDMVLESNRDLVLRRLTECLGRDRTKHQVAEVTSLGLVQMTRKRVGQGLLEVFSEPCEHCRGRGVLVQVDPVDEKKRSSGNGGNGGGGNGAAGNGGGGRNRGDSGIGSGSGSGSGSGAGSDKGSDKGSDRSRDKGRDDRAKDADVPTPDAKDAAPATAEVGPEGDAADVAGADAAETGGGRGRRSRGGRDRGSRGGNATERGSVDAGSPAPQADQSAAADETAPETADEGTAPSRREDPAAGWDVADAMALQGGASFDEPAAGEQAAGEQVAEPTTESTTEPAGEGRGRRNRGRRGRGQSAEARGAEDAPVAEAPTAEAPTAEAPADEEPLPAGETAVQVVAEESTPDTVLAAAVAAPTAAPDVPAGAAEQSEPTVVVAPEPVAEPVADQDVPVVRPRRRRAASRPAGPPA
ncbi:Rne/Rng family ribonuclease [Modestobacter sp. VKM Ac-2978]|uniref:Rne/Rng family ribonuclease n=1 Tax=Modestobacter sp. VKM Ac-2978 TaxID=3004132 RepID=UPI0022A9FA5E|nr:Rne/Rng family ribonuclease [Modestobacter sp. VKM Ac-2978]MCZ2847340.1 Rne/Rng family ribonuclease [Modestobacter sp. VKM Ac-2978]